MATCALAWASIRLTILRLQLVWRAFAIMYAFGRFHCLNSCAECPQSGQSGDTAAVTQPQRIYRACLWPGSGLRFATCRATRRLAESIGGRRRWAVADSLSAKMGRPKLPKSEAKGVLIGASFSPPEARQVIDAVKRVRKVASSGIIVGRFEAPEQPARRTLEPLPCTKHPLQRGQSLDRARLGAFPACTSAHPATAQTKPRTPCFSSLKAVFSDFYPLNSPNIRSLHSLKRSTSPMARREPSHCWCSICCLRG